MNSNTMENNMDDYGYGDFDEADVILTEECKETKEFKSMDPKDFMNPDICMYKHFKSGYEENIVEQNMDDHKYDALDETDVITTTDTKAYLMSLYKTENKATHTYMNGGKLKIPYEKLSEVYKLLKKNKTNPPLTERIDAYGDTFKFFIDVDDEKVDLEQLIKETQSTLDKFFILTDKQKRFTVWNNSNNSKKYHIIWQFKCNKKDALNCLQLVSKNLDYKADTSVYSSGLRFPYCNKDTNKTKNNSIYKYKSGYKSAILKTGSILYIDNLPELKYTDKYVEAIKIIESDTLDIVKVGDLKEQYIEQILIKYNQYTISKITDNKNGIFYIELNYVNQPCLLSPEHTHKNNKQYIILDVITAQYKFKCHSEKCNNKIKHHYLNVLEECVFDYEIVTNWIKGISDNKSEAIITNRVKEYVNKHYVFVSGATSDLFLEINYGENGKRRVYYKNSLKTILNKYKITYSKLVKNEDEEEETKRIQKKTTLYDMFINSSYMRAYSDLVINATHTEKSHEFNTFDRFNIIEKEAIEEDISPFLYHIKHIWCKDNNDKYEYVLNWMAHCVQFPNIKTKVALVLMSKPGSGKGVIVQKFSKIFGHKYYLHCNDFETILGNFNSQLEGKFLVFLDECVWGGNKKDSGKLKTFITEETRQINKKNIPKYTVNCVANAIIASNEDWVIPAGKGARRFFILDLDDEYSGNKSVKSEEYFTKLNDVNDNAIAHFFYNRDLSTFVSTKIPHSDMLQEQQTMSLNSIESFVLSLLQGDAYLQDENKEPAEMEGWHLRKNIYNSFIEYCRENNTRIEKSPTFWTTLKKILPYTADAKNDKMIRGFRMKHILDLDVNRELWTKHMSGWNWKHE